MADCHKCKKKLPFFTIQDKRRPNPLGNGYLCKRCYQPYQLFLEKYLTNVEKVETDPRAAAWVALCCLLAAQRINIVRTVTAVLCGIFEKQHSWEVCRERTVRLATRALSLVASDANGRMFLREMLHRAEAVSQSPPEEISIRLHASVMGDTIPDLEYQALLRSGLSIDDLNELITSLPGHQWLLSPNPNV